MTKHVALSPTSFPSLGRVLAVVILSLLFAGCIDDSSGPPDVTLSSLTSSSGDLDQVFQSSQTSYTASVNFLQTSITVTPTTADPNATVTVNGTAVISGQPLQAIALAEGTNAILIVITGADGSTTVSYSLTVTRASVASFAQQAYLKASNAEGFDSFGVNVAISGDTLVVGASGEDSSAAGGEADNTVPGAGAAYVFVRAGGVWSQQAYLKASNAGGDDLFGGSVAISGDTLVVGASGEDSSAAGGEGDNSAPGAGAAYVFARAGGVWTQQAYLKASNAEAGDQFSDSVAISGDTLVVGAIFEDSSAAGGETDNSAPFAGAVYVFARAGGVWSQQAYLKASNAEGDDIFGRNVAISGDTLVVGANGEDSSAAGGEADNTVPGAGAAYVFVRAGGVWTQQAYLKASNAETNDFFGGHVAISGDTLVVGARLEDSSAAGGEADNSAPSAGAAYVFARAGGVWTQQAYLKASNAESSDFFGGSVAISGDRLVVGAGDESSSAAGGEGDNSALEAGAAYVFTRTGGVWSQQAYLKASNAETNDSFSGSVSISGDTLVVGANGEDSSAVGGEADNSASVAGAAYTWQ